MLKNLRARGCPLAGAAACQSLQSQEKRLDFLNETETFIQAENNPYAFGETICRILI